MRQALHGGNRHDAGTHRVDRRSNIRLADGRRQPEGSRNGLRCDGAPRRTTICPLLDAIITAKGPSGGVDLELSAFGWPPSC
ncbi:hypothetical protein CKO51_22605 [Rhodopirellula sp. SM50]|nr:hypothetical protein CKO51_22605 [Rhodopirellula sp. SM50]